MSAFVDEELHRFARLWWLVVLFGVAVLGVGVFFVVSPHETLSTFTIIAGILLLVDGVLAIVASVFGRGDGRGLLALVGVLSAIAGLVLIVSPWLLGFQNTDAMSIDVIIGISVALLAAFEVYLTRDREQEIGASQ